MKTNLSSTFRNQKPEHRNQKIEKILLLASCFWFLVSGYWLLCSTVYADTIYFKNGATEKALVVEEYYDRFIFSTADGEKEIFKYSIDEVFFDEPHQNNLYIGRRFEKEGDFEKAFLFYQLALQSNSDFKEAEDAIKGIEDAKWRFGKTWRYKELKEILKNQLGISLKSPKGMAVIQDAAGPLDAEDIIIRCWAQPLTYAGLKNSAKILTGLSNTILKLVIERNIEVPLSRTGLKLFSSFMIDMGVEGPVVKAVKEGEPLYAAGLREGDLIVKINQEPTRYMKLAQIKRKISHRAKEGMLTVRREVMLMRKRSENKLTNAMWIWHSKAPLLNESEKKGLLDFCNEKNIVVLFFQLQYQFVPKGPTVVCRLLYETRLRAFLKEAHSKGITVYALDGAPEFCLGDKHHLVLAQIKALLDFNKKGSSYERFDGVHYDNEPYLLPAFHSRLKKEVISQFLELNKRCKDLINASGLRFDFGIDIPFWFDELDRLDAKLIDICDNVGIMDYRNFASSPDGIIAHALDELRYASEVKKRVFVGVETSRYPKQEVYFGAILNEEEFNARQLRSTRFEDFPLRVHYDDKRFYIGLVKPEGADERRFQDALSKLRALVGGQEKAADDEADKEFTSDVLFALSTNPEFVDPKPEEYTDESGRTFLMFVAREVMLEKITFAGMREDDLNNVLAEAKKEFKNYPGFAGFAFHHYKSYKELCEKK